MEIVIHSTSNDERVVKRVDKNEVWLGRREDCEITLANMFVSKKHARISKEGDNYFVEHFGLNGTFLNNVDIEREKKYKLKPKDEIKIAEYEIYVVIGNREDEADRHKNAEMMRKILALQTRIHSELLKRMDLRSMQSNRDYEGQSQAINRHLESALEDHVDGLEPELRDFIVRLAFRREIGNLIDHGEERPQELGAKGDQGEFLHRNFEDRIQEIVRRVTKELGVKFKRESRRADKEILENGFEESFGHANVQVSGALGKYVVKRWLRKELRDIILGLGPLQDLIDVPSISEIMVINKDQIYVEQDGVIEDSGRSFISDDLIVSVLERIVSPLGRRIDRSVPLVDARLPDGSRVNAIIPPLAVKGPCITIRKFARKPLTVEDLVENGGMTAQVATFLKACVVGRTNLIVSGGTGSGKTTLLNVLSSFIPPSERIVTIEDSAELQLFQKHVVTLEAKPPNVEGTGAYTIRDLVKNALRMRPDRIIVGECRSGEALDMLQAMNTGHDGSMTTGHANTPHDMMLRLETMVLMAVDMPVKAIREQIASALDLVVQMERFATGERRITYISELVGLDEQTGELILEDIFHYRALDDGQEQRLLHTGYIPTFAEELITKNILLLESLFG